MGPMPSVEGKQWCLPKAGVDPDTLQRNIDYVCGLGLNCWPIEEGGACFEPNTVRAHAAYAMNVYYQAMGMYGYDCDFEQTGAITDVDPSKYMRLFFFILIMIYSFFGGILKGFSFFCLSFMFKQAMEGASIENGVNCNEDHFKAIFSLLFFFSSFLANRINDYRH